MILFKDFNMVLNIIIPHLSRGCYYDLKWYIKTIKLTAKLLIILWKKLSLSYGMYRFIKIEHFLENSTKLVSHYRESYLKLLKCFTLYN